MTTLAPIHARRLAAALLLAVAALLAAPPDASAQTNVWSATLTVGSQYLLSGISRKPAYTRAVCLAIDPATTSGRWKPKKGCVCYENIRISCPHAHADHSVSSASSRKRSSRVRQVSGSGACTTATAGRHGKHAPVDGPRRARSCDCRRWSRDALNRSKAADTANTTRHGLR